MAGKAKIVTPERREEIDRVMEQTDGVLTTSAKILGCSVLTLRKHIESDDILLRKWKPEWIKEEKVDEEIHRPVQLNGQQRAELAMAKEDKSLSTGFRDLGFNDEEIEFLVPIAGFTNGRMDQVIDLTYGGMVRNSAKLLKLFADTQEALAEMMKNPSLYNEYGEKGNITYSGDKKVKEMMNALIEIQKETRNTNKAAEETMIVRAKLHEIKKRQLEESNKPNKVPGFSGPPEVFGNPTFVQNNHYGKQEKQADADV